MLHLCSKRKFDNSRNEVLTKFTDKQVRYVKHIAVEYIPK